MAAASYVVPNFLGGEISQFAQGRVDKPDYHVSLSVCLNAFPVEIGPWTRRPGTRHGGPTRGGAPGRVMGFDFEQSAPITTEYTDGFLRFRNGAALITTNDAQVLVAISSANPAVAQTTTAHGWSTGNTVIFPGACTPLLENRQFLITVTDSTHFSLKDALTGANIDGSTLGALVAGATVERVLELTTVYGAGAWQNIRAVQAETTQILLSPSAQPQALTVTALPTAIANPTFSISAATFNDGPYLDAFTNGVQITPNAVAGIVTMTVSFPAYSASVAYPVGAFVTSSGVNYVSLKDQNVGNTPVSSGTFWKATAPGAAINGGQGFQATDIGRLARLYSQPAAWAVGSTYSAGAIVSYNPSGIPGADTFWSSPAGGNIGNVPGTDATHWALVSTSGAALWTWGKITSLSNAIPSNPSGIVHIGNMTGNGGLTAAFNGIIGQNAAASADVAVSGNAVQSFSYSAYVGQNYGGTSTTAYAVTSATIFPASDLGFLSLACTFSPVPNNSFQIGLVATLYGSNSLPATPTNGTVLGSATVFNGSTGIASGTTTNFAFNPITIQSTDTTTIYRYVWMTLTVQVTGTVDGGIGTFDFQASSAAAQVQFVSAAGTGTSSGVNIEILGPSLLYTSLITTWRLGVYSNTTGYPTCGCYHEGRLFLGGAVPNRWDASYSNGVAGNSINFAPTDQYGAVSAAHAISYTFNSDSVNPINWMIPDLQGVIMGTLAGEWLVQAPTSGPLAAANVAARRVTKIGCASVEPRRTEHTIVFVRRYGRKLMEYFADVFSGKFSAPNLADKAMHIARTGISELAYTEAVNPLIWGRCADGSWFGVTYKRDTLTTSQGPTFVGWHRHALGSGRTVESICSGPSVGGDLDALTMATNDTTTGIRHVEVLTDALDELAPLSDAWFLDDAVAPTSTSSTLTPSTGFPYGGLTLNGLWHLNGKTVQVFAGGLDCGDPGEGKAPSDFVVASGSVTVPYADGISAGPGSGLFTAAFVASFTGGCPIVVGMTYNSDGQMVRPNAQPDTGARNGPGFGKLRRQHRLAALVNNAKGIMFGTGFSKLLPALFRTDDNKLLTPLQTYSGLHQMPPYDSDSYESQLCWRVSRPFPATVVAIGGNIDTKDQ